MAEGGFKTSVDPLQRPCLPATGASVPPSVIHGADEKHIPGSSTDISTTHIADCQNVVTMGNVSNSKISITNPPQDADVLAQKIQNAEVQNLLKDTTSNIQNRTRGMVRTSALKAVMDKLTTGTTWVTIAGQPGEGKSTAAFMALGELQQKGRQVFQIISPEELTKVTATSPNPVIMLDDIFGALEFDQYAFSKWEPVLHKVLGLSEHSSHEKGKETLKKEKMTVIFTGRDYVLKSASSKMGRLSDYFTSDQHVVYMSKPGERGIQEKLDIWNAISEASGIVLGEKTIDSICNINVPHGFPHVCRLFVTMRKEGDNIDAEIFFKTPLKFLNQTVQQFMENGVQLSLFKEMIKRNGSVNIRDLGNVHIIKFANSLVGSYLNSKNGNFTFNHPSIYDSVAFNICKTYPLFVIENCRLSFLHERLRLESTSNESSRVVYIPSQNLKDLAKRFAKEIMRGNLFLVLSHPAVRDETFVIKMMSYIWLPGFRLPRLTDRNTGHSFLYLIASSKSYQILKYLDNHRLRKLSTSQLTSVLYGVCKYDALDVLKYLENPILGQLSKSQLTTVLCEVCAYGAVDVLTYLLQSRDVDLNEKMYGRSLLWFACEYNQVDVARVLIDRGARADADTAVKACRRGNLDLVKLLWEGGATVNMTADWDTPLTVASEGGHVKVMRFLFAKGASVNTADRIDRSPLHRACESFELQAVQWLLEHGADIYSRDYLDRTPLDLVVRYGSNECSNLLQNAIADREIKNNRGETVNTK